MSPVHKVLHSIGAFALATAGLVAADDAGHAAAVTSYPFDTCIISGEAFGGEIGDPVVITHEGREVKFCCKSCVKTFTKEPAKYAAIIDHGIEAKAAGKVAVNPAAGDKHAEDAKDAGEAAKDHGDAAKDDAHQDHDHGNR